MFIFLMFLTHITHLPDAGSIYTSLFALGWLSSHVLTIATLSRLINIPFLNAPFLKTPFLNFDIIPYPMFIAPQSYASNVPTHVT